nr:L476 [uncultured bacterium]
MTPSIALGIDLNTFDAFMVPALDLQYGDHWRVKFEADIFLPRSVEKTNLGVPGADSNDAHLLGSLHNRDQLVARITYQF